jgi:hypothetical protein
MKTNILIIFLFLSILMVFETGCSKIDPKIEIPEGNESVIIKGWTPSESELNEPEIIDLRVWDETQQLAMQTRIEGDLMISNDKMSIFYPVFPLEVNTTYQLRIQASNLNITKIISIPDKERKQSYVTKIYPSADTLPENLLRMYVCFSQAMKTKGAIEYIKLYDENGHEITKAIFRNVFELWDADQKRLTILFDPARVKTGLRANLENGRALQKGKKYELIVEQAEDIYGNPIQAPFKKSFVVASVDLTIPDIKQWKLAIPHSHSREKFQISFPEILDHSSLSQRIYIKDPFGKFISGKIKIINKEKQWQLIPDTNWIPGEYTLQVNARLEDPAGNNLNGLFDHKIGSLKNEKEGEIISLNFKVL